MLALVEALRNAGAKSRFPNGWRATVRQLLTESGFSHREPCITRGRIR